MRQAMESSCASARRIWPRSDAAVSDMAISVSLSGSSPANVNSEAATTNTLGTATAIGEQAGLIESVRGRAGGELNGSPTSYGFVHVFHVQEGRVPHFDEYIAQPAGGFPA